MYGVFYGGDKTNEMQVMGLVVAISFLIVTWYFYVEDRFLLKIVDLPVSDLVMEAKSGDILRVGVTPEGSVASHWLGRPLHHYVFVQAIDHKLYVIHTWYKKLTTHGNIHIPPSYQLQPIEDFVKHCNMRLVEIFRHPDMSYKNLSIEDVTSSIRSFGNSVRCYITVMNIIDKLYPEMNISFSFLGDRRLRNICLWSFLFYKPLYFEKTILAVGFKHFDIMLLENILKYK